MDKRTLTALQESIEKWRQIERGEMPDLGTLNCSLCAEFWDMSGCERCLVSQHTHKGYCFDTPYVHWYRAQKRKGRYESDCDFVADTPKLVKLARAERKFLESLLPKD